MRVLLLLVLLFAAFPSFAEELTLETTAVNLVLQSDKYADLENSTVKNRVAFISSQLGELHKQFLTDFGKAKFLLTLPYQRGMLMFGLKEPYLSEFVRKFPPGTYPVNGPIFGDSVLDNLNEKFAASELTVINLGSRYLFRLKVDPKYNMFRIAQIYSRANLVEYAEGSILHSDARYAITLVILPSVQTFILQHGWGDCMAGCPRQHRRYYELGYAGFVPKLVGTSGHDISQSPEEKLFLF